MHGNLKMMESVLSISGSVYYLSISVIDSVLSITVHILLIDDCYREPF